MDLIQVIRDNCNPVTINDLIKIVNAMNDLNYDEYMSEMYDKVEEVLENDSVNVGRIVTNILLKHTVNILLELGVTINTTLDDITVDEMFQILNFQLLPEYADVDKAEFIVNAFEENDDLTMSYANIIAQFTHISFTRAYNIIDSTSLIYVNKLIEINTNIISNRDIDDSVKYNLVNIIKELRISDGFEIIGLRLIRNDFDTDTDLEIYLRVAGERLDNKTMEETAADFMSLLILGSNSRFDRVKKYVEICEDLLDDEGFKSSVFQRIKMLDEQVQVLYDKYNIKEDIKDGED